jgi:hypothetical protein
MRAGRAGLHLSQAAVERSETTRAFALAVGVSVTASARALHLISSASASQSADGS